MASTRCANQTWTDQQHGATPDAARSAFSGISPFHAVATFVLVGLFSIVSMLLERHSEGVAVIWLSNGLLFGILVRERTATWPLYGLLGWAADTAGSVAVGEPVLMASISALGNSFEIFLAAFLLVRWFGSPLRLSRPKPLFAFFLLGVLFAPGLASIPSVAWLHMHKGYPVWTTFRTLFLGDTLGMAIIAPLTHVVLEPRFFAMFKRRAPAHTLLVLTAPVLAAALDFGLDTEPVLFLLVPALVFVAFRLGFPGAVVAIFLIFCIAIPLTVTGHGPLLLSTGTSMLHKIVVVQIVVAIALFTSFPVAAVLEERTALEYALVEHQSQLVELATTDALTGQSNRRAFDDRLQAEWQQAATTSRPLTLFSIDIDFFKSFNDLYGHPAGDDCLRRVAALVAQTLPPQDATLYRLGGEEFAVLFPGADATQAHVLAERIRQAILFARIEHTGNPLGVQTVSVGTATVIPAIDVPATSLLDQSDHALYAAKHNGRNRCEIAA